MWLHRNGLNIFNLKTVKKQTKKNMFCWTSSSVGSEPLDGVANMSKSDILRGIITEKLSTAAREILAVVERTIADYEEEVAGFRQEIDRQRRLLELLQPRVKLERRELTPELHSCDVLMEASLEENEHHTQQSDILCPDVKDTVNSGLPVYDNVDEEGVEMPFVQPDTSSTQHEEHLKEPDHQIPFETKRPSKALTGGTQTLPNFRIRILEDSQTEVLSNLVFKKCPVQDLRCPPGLQEDDFLELLRSAFPQLGSDEPLDFFTSSTNRRLQPLQVEPRTPEVIYKAIKTAGSSALYIRPKKQDDNSRSNPATPSADGAKYIKRVKYNDAKTPIDFRIRILEDSQIDTLSNTVFKKCPMQNLTCPRGLQEDDFLELLRSTFPQLGSDEPLDFLISSSHRKLQLLQIEPRTPEVIYNAINAVGNSALYIRPKTGKEEEKTLHSLQTNVDPVSSDAEALRSVKAKLLSSSPTQHDDDTTVDVLATNSTSENQDLRTEEDVSDSEVNSSDGMNEDEMLDGDDDWKPDPKPQLPKTKKEKQTKKKQVAKCWIKRFKGKISCKVCGVEYTHLASLMRHIWSHVDEPQSVCGVCGKTLESVEKLKEHLQNYQKTYKCLICGKSFYSRKSFRSHVSFHTANKLFKCNVCSKTFPRMSALRIHRSIHGEEKLYQCDICPKSFGLKGQLTAHTKTHTRKERYHCKICGKSVSDRRALSRHKLTHTGERQYCCHICGKQFRLQWSLKSHEKIHTARDQPYLCHICCKTFTTNQTLKAHLRTHSNEKPFVCVTCNKGFVSNGELKKHLRVHSGEAPYGCTICGRFFKQRAALNSHVKIHAGIKQFVCEICGKACSRKAHLKIHMRIHNGERPYQCTLCEKAFTQSHCLKSHMKIHQPEEHKSDTQSTL
ncbi:zinc finger and SCAN domain-containing protein 2-like isoform X1 [Oreochromis aureus]|uniref:zinc finger and SCAN domain-containing protein 2-like isoform X1 n=2 Tax=Oreochromis aureus TaxID=47969 RepID=UPI0019534402|nr:zinc finger and SCAN domain-containing protein 2-like isoform X1 [Oreochromis aureus]